MSRNRKFSSEMISKTRRGDDRYGAIGNDIDARCLGCVSHRSLSSLSSRQSRGWRLVRENKPELSSPVCGVRLLLRHVRTSPQRRDRWKATRVPDTKAQGRILTSSKHFEPSVTSARDSFRVRAFFRVTRRSVNPEGDDFGAKNCPANASGGYVKGARTMLRHLRLPRQ